MPQRPSGAYWGVKRAIKRSLQGNGISTARRSRGPYRGAKRAIRRPSQGSGISTAAGAELWVFTRVDAGAGFGGGDAERATGMLRVGLGEVWGAEVRRGYCGGG